MKTSLAVAAAALLSLTPAAFAQAPGSAATPAPAAGTQRGTMEAAGHPSKATANFVQKAAMTDMFEIQAGQLAQEKSQNQNVKQFGQQMVTDHTQTSEKLKSIASAAGMTVPAALDQEHQKLLTQLRGDSGAKFDRAYVSSQRTGHKQAIALYENYVKHGQNAELKQFAQQTLPTLRHHLQMADNLKVGAKRTGS